MEENKIKEAAEKYMKSDELRYFQDPCDLDVKDAFIAGAKWALQNQWHDVKNELPCNHPELIEEDGPIYTHDVLCKSEKGTLYVDYMIQSRISKEWKWSAENRFDCKRWMPIPSLHEKLK